MRPRNRTGPKVCGQARRWLSGSLPRVWRPPAVQPASWGLDVSDSRLHEIHFMRLLVSGSVLFGSILQLQQARAAAPERFLPQEHRALQSGNRCSGTGEYLETLLHFFGRAEDQLIARLCLRRVDGVSWQREDT